MILLLGGARSGKSSLAVNLASRTGAPVRLIATGTPDDEEMAQRIAHHRRHRPEHWVVVEAPTEVSAALRAAARTETVVLDCVTLWISNLMVNKDDDAIGTLVDEVITSCTQHHGQVIVVSNEVGMGLVPMDPVGRRFRDLQGWANQRFADAADSTYLVAAGRALRLQEWHDVD